MTAKKYARRDMPKDDARGARTGRNVRLTVMLSEEAEALLDAAVERRSQGVRKATKSEILDELILANRDELKRRP